MEFFRRVLGGRSANSVSAAPLALFDSSSAPDSRRPDTLLAALDIDAAINSHERWKTRLMDYLEGRTSYGVDPALVRRDTHSALGRWLHGVGAEVLGDPSPPTLCCWRGTNTFMNRRPIWSSWHSKANGTRPCRCSTAATAMARARWCCCSRSSNAGWGSSGL